MTGSNLQIKIGEAEIYLKMQEWQTNRILNKQRHFMKETRDS